MAIDPISPRTIGIATFRWCTETDTLLLLATLTAVENDLQIGTIRVSGIEVEVAGEANDLYFRQCLEQGEIFEPSVRVADLVLPDDPVILDIGASIGGVTAALAKRFPSGRLIAFEAAPSVHPSLRETVRRASGAPVTVVEQGVGAESGTMRFHEDGNGSGWGFLSEELGGVSVPVVTVDETVAALLLDRVDFIKIDVEGGELGVLQGAETTLLRHQPLLLFEVNVFCLWRYGRTLPQDLLAWVRQRYSHTAAIDNEGTVTHIEGDATVNHVLHLLGTGSGVIDVIASNEPIGVTTNTLRAGWY
jgi:FkbM family methyltransferase